MSSLQPKGRESAQAAGRAGSAPSQASHHLRQLAGSWDLLDLQRLAPGRYPFLLESTGGPAQLAAFDILFAFPGQSLTLGADGRLEGRARSSGSNDFLAALNEWWAAERAGSGAEPQVPFRGGWFVFLSYELAQQIEPSIGIGADASFPVARAVRVPAAIVRDHGTGHAWAIAEAARRDLLDEIEADIARLAPIRGAAPMPPQLLVPGSIVEDEPQAFLAAVRHAKGYIAAGDIYQANISRRWAGRLAEGAAPAMLYERLRRSNPAPFAGIALLGDGAVVSSSPERLLRIRDGRVETRPIAGTRPRQATEDGDRARRQELIGNPKERAEHVMLIDLERNDLGRVCRPGSVRVDELMAVESYAHVHHIVSNVSGELLPGMPPGDVLRAVFPGGTITGCPKVQCMKIIRELEGRPRGAYTGAMGYLNRDGSCDFNILIRTITVRGREFSLSAGAGIVADSNPERELEETRAKAKGMLLSLREQA